VLEIITNYDIVHIQLLIYPHIIFAKTMIFFFLFATLKYLL